jgi:hypothetical protein
VAAVKSLTIPAGSNTCQYTLSGLDRCSYQLAYHIADTYTNGDLIKDGYYRQQGTASNPSLAGSLDVSGGNLSNINIDLLTGTSVSGKIILPADSTAGTRYCSWLRHNREVAVFPPGRFHTCRVSLR